MVEEKENTVRKKPKQISILPEGLSLDDVVHHTLPNLTYLQLRRNKSNLSTISVEQRFPDKISNWKGFKDEVRSWQSGCVDKKYKEPLLRTRTITCEKDVWTALEINIHDILTPLDKSIQFLDGRALEGVAVEPDFIVVDEDYELLMPLEYKTRWVLKVPSNKNIVTLYQKEKETREGKLVLKNTNV